MAAVYKSLSKKGSNGTKADAPANGVKKNKQRVLALSSRGVTFRHRHLLKDLADGMPHAKLDSKFDSKNKLFLMCELAELYNCNNVLFFEARKGQDLYVWLSKVPNGPTVKFHLENAHTMSELNFTGNCLKGSRPILSFDAAFDSEPHLKLIKELFTHTFGVPPGARRSKPFVDHVLGFSVADGRIWVRNYQINETTEADKEAGTEGMNLLEIGPRFALTPLFVQEGSFGGPLIYKNDRFVSPNQVRADLRKKQASKHNARAEQAVERLAKKGDLGLRTSGGKRAAVDALDKRQLFA